MLFQKLKFISFLLIFISFGVAHAQVAVISSSDGFANIRKAPNSKAPIVDKLKKYSIFLLDQLDQDIEQPLEWYGILYFDNDLQKSLGPNGRAFKTGFIHKSQFTLIENLHDASPEEIQFEVNRGPFTRIGKTIKFYNESSTVPKSINGQHYFSSDCGLPRQEVKSIIVKMNGKTLEVPKSYIFGVLNATEEYEVKKLDNQYFVLQMIGDGSCFNFLVWEFDPSGLRQRFVGWQF